MKINSRVFCYVFFQILLILMSIGILVYYKDTTTWENFYFLCVYGTIICVTLNIILCIIQKKIFTALTLVFMSFWIFQFGLPLVYVFVENYNNFYINLFDYKTIINGAIYSILSIQIFALSISCYLMKERKRISSVFEKINWIDNTKIVSKAALYMFLVTGIVAFPLICYSAYSTVTLGFFAASTRSYLSSKVIFKIAQTFFFPSGLLFICFNTNKRKQKIVTSIILIYCAMQIIAGDRTNGLTGVLVIIFYYVFANKEVSKKKKHSIITEILFGAILGVIVIVLVYIAKARVSDTRITFSEVLSNGIFKSFFAELGFNFTTICFVMTYVPYITKFQYGLTYISSFLCLIPKSLDPTGTISLLSEGLGEMWLYNINQMHYGELLNFGVGFSVIGESFYNFGWYGILCFFVIGWIIASLLGKDLNKCNGFEKYIQLVLLLGFLTFPRRQFYDMLKDIEYGVIFIYIYICIMYKFTRKYKKGT